MIYWELKQKHYPNLDEERENEKYKWKIWMHSW